MADNNVAEAWAASDESGKAAWQEIRYRMISGQAYGLNTWNELRIGMLSAGLLGSPGLGYAKDRFAGEALQAVSPSTFDAYKADTTSKFLK